MWIAQAVAPIKQFEQDPPAMRQSWLFKEMARCVIRFKVLKSWIFWGIDPLRLIASGLSVLV